MYISQSVEMQCTEQLQAAGEQLSGRQEEVKRALLAVQNQASQDQTVLHQQQVELREHVETSERLVHSFLQDELQQDVPTGNDEQGGVSCSSVFMLQVKNIRPD